VHVLLELPALDIKHVDEDLHIAEDVVALARKVVLHESLLTIREGGGLNHFGQSRAAAHFNSLIPPAPPFECSPIWRCSGINPSNEAMATRAAMEEREKREERTCPPQSQRLSTRFPKNLTCECSTSTIGQEKEGRGGLKRQAGAGAGAGQAE